MKPPHVVFDWEALVETLLEDKQSTREIEYEMELEQDLELELMEEEEKARRDELDKEACARYMNNVSIFSAMTDHVWPPWSKLPDHEKQMWRDLDEEEE